MSSVRRKHQLRVFKINKKVLLRERKRHTTRRVASTPYVVLTGYPPWQGTPQPGYPPLAGPGRVPPPPGWTWQGTPAARVPPQPGYPPGWTWQGTPPARVPPRSGYPPGQGTPPARVPPRPGYPSWLDLAGYPPWLPHGILGNVAKHYGIWVPPLWTDRLMDGWKEGQTRVKTLPSRRTTYAGGNKTNSALVFIR